MGAAGQGSPQPGVQAGRAGYGPGVELAKKVPAVVAIVALVVVELRALAAGVDGVALTAAMVAISGLGGFYLHDWIRRAERL